MKWVNLAQAISVDCLAFSYLVIPLARRSLGEGGSERSDACPP
jgi:hypothetical protein